MARIQSGASAATLNVDPLNRAVRVSLYDTGGVFLAAAQGADVLSAQGFPCAGVDGGTARVMRLDRLGSSRIGFDNLLLHDDVEGTTINTQLWNKVTTTFTQAQTTATGIDFNSANTLAANSNSTLTSLRYFSKTQLSPLRLRIRCRVIPQTNVRQEFGFGLPSGVVAQIPSGSFWRYTATGTVIPVLAYGGADVVLGTDISALLQPTRYYTWDVAVDDDSALFTCMDSSTGRTISEQTLQIPATQPKMWSPSRLPTFIRQYVSTTAAPAAPKFFLSSVAVSGHDLALNKTWQQVACANGGSADVHPTTLAQTATWANSTAPTFVPTIDNVTATTVSLGGLWFNGAAASGSADNIVFSFPIPAGYTFVCTGIDIVTLMYSNGVATNPYVFHWGVTNNASAVSLATANLTRRHIGVQGINQGDDGGAPPPTIRVKYDPPLRTEGGKSLTIFLRNPVLISAQTFEGSVNVHGYFE